MKKILFLIIAGISILFLQNCEVPSEIAESEVNNQAPAVTITSPVSTGYYLSGMDISLEVQATDEDGEVDQIKMTIDGNETTVDAAKLSIGDHTLEVVATDDFGGETTESVTFNVKNKVPDLTIISPEPAQQFITGTAVKFEITAADTNGTVDVVKFERDGEEIPAVQNGDNYSYNWTSATEGTHIFKVTATDNDEGIKIDSVSIVVSAAENEAPTCAITSLTNETIINVDQIVPIIVDAQDSDGEIVKVEWYIDGALKNLATVAPYQFDYTVEEISSWSHIIYAKAYDNQDAVTQSEAIEVRINKKPMVELIPFAADWAILPDAEINFSANITDPDGDGSIEVVQFYIDDVLIEGEVEQQESIYSINYTSENVLEDKIIKLKVVAFDNENGITEQETDVLVSILGAGFELYDDFILEFQPWIQYDLDGLGTYTIQDTEFTNQGYTGSFIIFNPTATVPAMSSSWTPHSGEKYAGCMAANGGVNNDWLVSPQMDIEEGDSLVFWAKSVSASYIERFRVGASLSGSEPEDFTTISDDYNAAGHDYIEPSAAAWQRYSLPLSEYAGTETRFSINCISDDAFMLIIDDIEIIKQDGKSRYNWNFEGDNTSLKNINSVPAKKAVK